jgi:hypothetical protein
MGLQNEIQLNSLSPVLAETSGYQTLGFIDLMGHQITLPQEKFLFLPMCGRETERKREKKGRREGGGRGEGGREEWWEGRNMNEYTGLKY